MSQIWEVVGGADKNGILVREGLDLKSPESNPSRVSTGALVQELELQGARLRFRLLQGEGPKEGWVSVRLKDKELVVKTDKKPEVAAAPATSASEVKKPEVVAAPATSASEVKKPEVVAAPATSAPEVKAPCALLFPGQGSQYVLMLSSMKDVPAVKDMLDKAKDILGWDPLKLCLEGPEDKLAETHYCQPCMFIAGLAAIEKLRAEKRDRAENPRFVAGLSLGEYTALCAAGVVTFEDGLKLVKARGEAMQEAASNGSKQSMLSVAGLEGDQLTALCNEARGEEGSSATCSIANALFPKGFVCGGTEKAILILKGKVMKAGALQSKVLKADAAFHTSLMQPAQEKLNKILNDMKSKMSPPKCTIYMNATSEPVPAGGSIEVIVQGLQKQLTSNVLWEASMKKMIEAGCTEYYECGPMKQLKAMMKRIDQKVWETTYNIDV